MPNWMDIDEKIRKKASLIIIPMRGWKRSMIWPETGLNWIATSPNIPSFSSVIGYAMTGLGAQEGNFSHGIGTPFPFRLLSHKQLSNDALMKMLRKRNIIGLDYKIIHTKNSLGEKRSGVYIGINDWNRLNPTEISFHMMQMTTKLETPNPFKTTKRSDLFNKHVGSTAWWHELSTREKSPRIYRFLKLWKIEHQIYKKKIENHLLYN